MQVVSLNNQGVFTHMIENDIRRKTVETQHPDMAPAFFVTPIIPPRPAQIVPLSQPEPIIPQPPPIPQQRSAVLDEVRALAFYDRYGKHTMGPPLIRAPVLTTKITYYGSNGRYQKKPVKFGYYTSEKYKEEHLKKIRHSHGEPVGPSVDVSKTSGRIFEDINKTQPVLEAYHRDGLLHRDLNKPAIRYKTSACGFERTECRRDGILHSDDDIPTVVQNGGSGTVFKMWYKDGVKHRDGGNPAVEVQSVHGSVVYSEIWHNGIWISSHYNQPMAYGQVFDATRMYVIGDQRWDGTNMQITDEDNKLRAELELKITRYSFGDSDVVASLCYNSSGITDLSKRLARQGLL
jgi:hypothetical protein